MACDEIGVSQQVGVPYGILAEAEVGFRHGARFLGVVIKVPLGEIVRLASDDLDRILVGPHRAVGPEPIEEGPVSVLAQTE